MSLSGLHLDVVFVFFIYGLAFFTMGIALVLETSRTPRLAERRVLRPLALFGLMHGVHEWLEIFLLQGEWLGQHFPVSVSWFRVAWLVLSFLPLLLFGTLFLASVDRHKRLFPVIPLGLLVLYGLSFAFNAAIAGDTLIARADALARYLLAVPAGLLGAWALHARASQVQGENRRELASFFRWSALGFGLYGLTQVLVSPVEMFPAQYINNQVFLSLFGFPIQVVRAAMALLVTINLLRAIQLVEREREAQLLAAQQARLDALELIQRELVERVAMRRELLRHTVIAQEDERARIARELHDETAQFLTALSLNLATLRNSAELTPAAAKILDRLQALSREMSQGVHRMVHDLRPAQLDDLGLVAALQYLGDQEKNQAGLNITLQVEGQRQRLDPLVETVLFRVAQEALTNVARHSKCDRAEICLCFSPPQVVLSIRDQGIGFRLDDKKHLFGKWGLAGMRERAESVGGELKVSSHPGRGTVVEIMVPIGDTVRDSAEEAIHEHHPSDAG
jgi:signal transduction histidine kinase